jgi:hypothetical protein
MSVDGLIPLTKCVDCRDLINMVSTLELTLICVVVFIVILYLYIRHNDAALNRTPPEVLKLSPNRCSLNDIHARAEKLDREPISISVHLPPKTGRYYIVVGGVTIFASFHAIASHLWDIAEWVYRRLDRPPSTPTWRRSTQNKSPRHSLACSTRLDDRTGHIC